MAMNHHAACHVIVPTMPLVILSLDLVPMAVILDCWTEESTTGLDLPVNWVTWILH
jgi:hypothetical protein